MENGKILELNGMDDRGWEWPLGRREEGRDVVSRRKRDDRDTLKS